MDRIGTIGIFLYYMTGILCLSPIQMPPNALPMPKTIDSTVKMGGDMPIGMRMSMPIGSDNPMLIGTGKPLPMNSGMQMPMMGSKSMLKEGMPATMSPGGNAGNMMMGGMMVPSVSPNKSGMASAVGDMYIDGMPMGAMMPMMGGMPMPTGGMMPSMGGMINSGMPMNGMMPFMGGMPMGGMMPMIGGMPMGGMMPMMGGMMPMMGGMMPMMGGFGAAHPPPPPGGEVEYEPPEGAAAPAAAHAPAPSSTTGATPTGEAAAHGAGAGTATGVESTAAGAAGPEAVPGIGPAGSTGSVPMNSMMALLARMIGGMLGIGGEGGMPMGGMPSPMLGKPGMSMGSMQMPMGGKPGMPMEVMQMPMGSMQMPMESMQMPMESMQMPMGGKGGMPIGGMETPMGGKLGIPMSQGRKPGMPMGNLQVPMGGKGGIPMWGMQMPMGSMQMSMNGKNGMPIGGMEMPFGGKPGMPMTLGRKSSMSMGGKGGMPVGGMEMPMGGMPIQMDGKGGMPAGNLPMPMSGQLGVPRMPTPMGGKGEMLMPRIGKGGMAMGDPMALLMGGKLGMPIEKGEIGLSPMSLSGKDGIQVGGMPMTIGGGGMQMTNSMSNPLFKESIPMSMGSKSGMPSMLSMGGKKRFKRSLSAKGINRRMSSKVGRNDNQDMMSMISSESTGKNTESLYKMMLMVRMMSVMGIDRSQTLETMRSGKERKGEKMMPQMGKIETNMELTAKRNNANMANVRTDEIGIGMRENGINLTMPEMMLMMRMIERENTKTIKETMIEKIKRMHRMKSKIDKIQMDLPMMMMMMQQMEESSKGMNTVKGRRDSAPNVVWSIRSNKEMEMLRKMADEITRKGEPVMTPFMTTTPEIEIGSKRKDRMETMTRMIPLMRLEDRIKGMMVSGMTKNDKKLDTKTMSDANMEMMKLYMMMNEMEMRGRDVGMMIKGKEDKNKKITQKSEMSGKDKGLNIEERSMIERKHMMMPILADNGKGVGTDDRMSMISSKGDAGGKNEMSMPTKEEQMNAKDVTMFMKEKEVADKSIIVPLEKGEMRGKQEMAMPNIGGVDGNSMMMPMLMMMMSTETGKMNSDKMDNTRRSMKGSGIMISGEKESKSINSGQGMIMPIMMMMPNVELRDQDIVMKTDQTESQAKLSASRFQEDVKGRPDKSRMSVSDTETETMIKKAIQNVLPMTTGGTEGKQFVVSKKEGKDVKGMTARMTNIDNGRKNGNNGNENPITEAVIKIPMPDGDVGIKGRGAQMTGFPTRQMSGNDMMMPVLGSQMISQPIIMSQIDRNQGTIGDIMTMLEGETGSKGMEMSMVEGEKGSRQMEISILEGEIGSQDIAVPIMEGGPQVENTRRPGLEREMTRQGTTMESGRGEKQMEMQMLESGIGPQNMMIPVMDQRTKIPSMEQIRVNSMIPMLDGQAGNRIGTAIFEGRMGANFPILERMRENRMEIPMMEGGRGKSPIEVPMLEGEIGIQDVMMPLMGRGIDGRKRVIQNVEGSIGQNGMMIPVLNGIEMPIMRHGIGVNGMMTPMLEGMQGRGMVMPMILEGGRGGSLGIPMLEGDISGRDKGVFLMDAMGLPMVDGDTGGNGRGGQMMDGEIGNNGMIMPLTPEGIINTGIRLPSEGSLPLIPGNRGVHYGFMV